ncbi:hypothetical protein [Bacillus phage MrBubbles]|nr:hypothetical protein [Bacillus phage MrBubbles]
MVRTYCNGYFLRIGRGCPRAFRSLGSFTRRGGQVVGY